MAWLLAVLSVPAFLYVVIFAAPTAELNALQQQQPVMESESRALCEKYGMAPGTQKHDQCVSDVMDLGMKHGERLKAAVDGIF